MHQRSTACTDFQRSQFNRRELLRLGGALGFGLLLPDVLRAQAQSQASSSSTFGRARSMILIYLHGGHAQQETWDPKPHGPSNVRGEFGAIPTSVPGIHISELLPQCARLMHRMALIRSMSHGNANHVQASLPALTGHVHPPTIQTRGDFPPTPNDFPPFGAVLNSLRPGGELPTWVQIGPQMRRNNGTILHGQLPGFLGARHSPLSIDQDLTPNDVRIDAVATNDEVPALRLTERGNLLEQIDTQQRQLLEAAEVQALDTYHQRALNLLTSAATARAFDLAAEPASVRDRYGRSNFGQCCLLARRLAEAEVPVINVHFCHTPRGSWDTHGNHFNQMRDNLCPNFDQAVSALIDDLDQRGLLGQTLVLPTAEFGRTPAINANAGRDHWPWAYAIAMAGGGVAGGVVHGASDNRAAYVTEAPHDPRDLAATVYHLLGVPADTTIYDQIHRPHNLIIGQKIDPVLL